MVSCGKVITEQQVREAMEICRHKTPAAKYLNIGHKRMGRLLERYGIDTAEYGCYSYGLDAALKTIIAEYEEGRTFTLAELCEELDFQCGTSWTEKVKVSEVKRKWEELTG